MISGRKGSAPVETQRALAETNTQGSVVDHEEAIALQGLDDLFQWASEMVADGLDGRTRRAREQRIKSKVLTVIHQNAAMQAKAKYADEVEYLHRRVIALQNVVTEKLEESVVIRQVMLAQHLSLQRVPELEEKIRVIETERVDRKVVEQQHAQLHGLIDRLQAEVSRYEEVEIDRDRLEIECKQLITALARLKAERDFLEELVETCEAENTRLANLLRDSKTEVERLKQRRWWHLFLPAGK